MADGLDGRKVERLDVEKVVGLDGRQDIWIGCGKGSWIGQKTRQMDWMWDKVVGLDERKGFLFTPEKG